MITKFIERPVLATVISTLLIILGLLSLFRLPLQQFPNIAPPAVLVTATYPGANAENILRSVIPSLEESINGVENMTYLTSTASNDGSLSITVYFQQGTDPDQAAVNVQNRVSQATSQLPAEVLQQGITTVKQQNSVISGLGIFSTDPTKYDQTFVTNYAQINIIPELKRIPGISSASIVGSSKDYSMRIWLDPAKMANYNLTPSEVMTAIQDKSLEAAPGRLGESSEEPFEYIIKYKGKLTKPEEYANIGLRTNSDGSRLLVKDVARVELGTYSYSSFSRFNGHDGVAINVLQLPGSNANEIQIAIDELFAKAAKEFPSGLDYKNFYRSKTALDASINQINHTLIEAFILVFIVVFVFLQDFRSTLIPAISVPVSIIGTFFFMQLFGFSVNLLTLFALILAIGIVVDDAIVVVEAVHSKMESRPDLTPFKATIESMSEVSGAIVSITLVMTAVFIPVGFLTGSSGIFYRQFAFTMAIAILISAVNALTLSPALAALFLKNTHGKNKSSIKILNTFFTGFDRMFMHFSNKYSKGLAYLINHKFITVTGLAVIAVLSFFLATNTQTGFIPTEDQGFLLISVSAPTGSSLQRTSAIVKEAETEMQKLPAVSFVTSVGGYNLLTNSNSSSAGAIWLLLKDTKDRGAIKDIDAIQETIRAKLTTIKDGTFFVFSFPTVPGFGNVEALDLVLQDKTGGALDKFSGVTDSFISKLMEKKEIGYAFTSFKANYPQLELKVDDKKADQLGVNVKDVLSTVQTYFGTAQVSDFNRFGKYYRVMAQANIASRKDPSVIRSLYVKNKQGEMVPLSELVSLERVYGSETASRYNLFNSIAVNVIPKAEFSTGDAIRAVEESAKTDLPSGYSYLFSGQTREQISSGNQSAMVFILSLVFVYFLLAAQYESYLLSLSVILSILPGVFGVFTTLFMSGTESNIYVQVALIMLIGLLAKNAILIVEFAVQRRKTGLSLVEAGKEAAISRLRPIIMTSLAFVFGLLPMTLATGPSAQGNHAISISAIGGMLIGVSLGIFVTPVLFVIFQHLQEKIKLKPIVEKVIMI